METHSVETRRTVYHVSDRPGITHFEPRPPPSLDAGVTEPVVWAIAERLLHNYLLPRDCPRVTFYPHAGTTTSDHHRFFVGSSATHVVAIESAWLDRVRRGRLWVYHFFGDTFEQVAPGSGYEVSRKPVKPFAVTELDDLFGALMHRDVDLRILPSLWPLRDAVLASSLQFSFIRMRNAQPRVEKSRAAAVT